MGKTRVCPSYLGFRCCQYAGGSADLDEPGLHQALILARRLGIEGVLLTACEVARLSFCSELPTSIVEAIARKPAIAGRAAAVWRGVLKGPANRKQPTRARGCSFFSNKMPDPAGHSGGVISDLLNRITFGHGITTSLLEGCCSFALCVS
jgi:hypothetical protein